MGEPARTESSEELTTDFVHRWVELPNGRMELQEFPLTPEYFLDPQIGDQVVQSFRHWRVTSRLWEIVYNHAKTVWAEVLVLSDQKLLWGHREWRQPAPDVAVIPEFPDSESFEGASFDVAETGYRPCLIIEVVSFSNARIRKTDLVDKVDLYEREKIREYLALDPPRRSNGHRFQWIGYRLDDQGRYRRIEPDDEGRLHAETVGLLFGVSPDGRDFEVFDVRTRERLWTAAETVKEATAARKAAEAEVARLREELARLKRSGD
ncbi:MAG: Uma2 family endonuclease [Thermoanaerobaculia bacterium]